MAGEYSMTSVWPTTVGAMGTVCPTPALVKVAGVSVLASGVHPQRMAAVKNKVARIRKKVCMINAICEGKKKTKAEQPLSYTGNQNHI